MAFKITFDVTKFSEALSAPGPTKIDWTHITASNMQVVLKGSDSRFSDGNLHMDVVQGTTFLERVNIAEYVDRAVRLRGAKDQAVAIIKLEELPIFGITKDPVLALRYSLNGKARRVQLRLKRSEDFQQMVSILSNQGMEFSQQRPSTGRPDTSSSRPNTTQQSKRPLTSSTSRSLHQDHSSSKSRPSPFNIPGIEAGSLSQRSVINALPPTNRAGQLVAPAPELSRDEHLAAHDVAQPSSAHQWPFRPSHSLRPDIYDVQQGPEERSDEGATKKNANLANPTYATQDVFQFSANGSELGAGHFKLPQQRLWWSSDGPPSHAPALTSDLVEPRPSTAFSMTSGTSIFPDTLENEIPPQRVLPFKATGSLRPSSAISIPSAASLNMLDTLEHEIPPRRDLPFKTTGCRSGGAGSSRPGSALPQPSEKPKKMQDGPKTASSAQKRHIEAHAHESHDLHKTTKRMRSPVQKNLSFAASKSAPDKIEGGSEAALPIKELIFGNRLSCTPKPRMSSTIDAPHEIESPPGSAEKLHIAAIPRATRFAAASMTWPAKSNGSRDTAVVPPNYSQELELEQYAAQSPEARQAALDQFMINSLQDPSFTTLCEDTEQSWRRIALGL